MWGIGASSPTATLMVSKPASDVDGAKQVVISPFNDSNMGLGMGYFYNPGVQAAGVIQSRDAGGGTHLLLNPIGGNVGIGTASPPTKLMVNEQALTVEAAKQVMISHTSSSEY